MLTIELGALSSGEFGQELYRLRVKNAMLQAQIAERAGLTSPYYSGVENSKRPPPPIPTVIRLARALNVTEIEEIHLLSLATQERLLRVNLDRQTLVHVANEIEKIAAALDPVNGELIRRKLRHILREETM